MDPSGLVASGLDFDDDLALLALLPGSRSKRTRITAVALTYGNAALGQVVMNARMLAQLVGLEGFIGLYPGAEWAAAGARLATQATKYYTTALRRFPPRSMDVLATGPLTNLASTFVQDGAEGVVAGRMNRLYFVGGDLNAAAAVHPSLNVLADRQAAAIVLAAPVAKVMIPAQTCLQVAFTATELQRLVPGYPKAGDCPWMAACEYAAALQAAVAASPPWRDLAYRGAAYAQWRTPRLERGFTVCDLVAVGALQYPDAFSDYAVIRAEMGDWRLDTTVLARGLSAFQAYAWMNGTDPAELGLPQLAGVSPRGANVVVAPLRVTDEVSLMARLVDDMRATPHGMPGWANSDHFRVEGLFSPIVLTLLGAVLVALVFCCSVSSVVSCHWAWRRGWFRRCCGEPKPAPAQRTGVCAAPARSTGRGKAQDDEDTTASKRPGAVGAAGGGGACAAGRSAPSTLPVSQAGQAAQASRGDVWDRMGGMLRDMVTRNTRKLA
jgi:hypothetical protein